MPTCRLRHSCLWLRRLNLTFALSHILALHLLTSLFFKTFVFIRVHPLPAIALAQARRAGWFPDSSFLFSLSYFLFPVFNPSITFSAAWIVLSICAVSCAAETKRASNCEGAM